MKESINIGKFFGRSLTREPFVAFFTFVVFGHILVGFVAGAMNRLITEYHSPFYFYVLKTFAILTYVLLSYFYTIKSIQGHSITQKMTVYACLAVFILSSLLFLYLFSAFSPLTFLGGFLYLGLIEGVWGTDAFYQAFQWWFQSIKGVNNV